MPVKKQCIRVIKRDIGKKARHLVRCNVYIDLDIDISKLSKVGRNLQHRSAETGQATGTEAFMMKAKL